MENPDVKKLVLGIPLFLLICLLLAGVWARCVNATVSGYYLTTALTYGADSSATVDSCRCYQLDGSNVSALDSANRLNTTAARLAGYAQDQLTRYAIITPGGIGSKVYNPAYVCLWFMSNGAILRDNSPQIVHTIEFVQPDHDMAIRYIDASGSNANGKTWETAWTGFDSIKTLNSPTVVYVGAGTYNNVVCSVRTSGIYLRGSGSGVTHVRGYSLDSLQTYDSGHVYRVFNVGDSSNGGSATRIVGGEISGMSIGHSVFYSSASPTPPDPEFQCAIWIYDSVHSFRIHDNFFVPDSNYKTISAGNGAGGWSRSSNNLEIDHNFFLRNRTHCLDLGTQGAYIHDNRLIDTRNYYGTNPKGSITGSIEPIQLIGGSQFNQVMRNTILSANIPIILRVADSNIVAENLLGLKWSTNPWIKNWGYADTTGADTAMDNAYVANWSPTPGDSGNMARTAVTIPEYIRDSVNATATATVDYDSINDIVIAAVSGGGGSEAVQIHVIDTSTSPDTKINGAQIVIRNSGLTSIVAALTTGTSGWRTFGLDTATGTNAYWKTADLPGLLFMDSAWSRLPVPGGAMQDTVYCYTYTPIPPGGGDSCTVVVFTDVVGSTASFEPLSSQLQDTSGVGLNPFVPITPSDGLGVIQRMLPRTAATRQLVKWKIVVKAPTGEVIMSDPNYTVPNQSIDTLLVPTR